MKYPPRGTGFYADGIHQPRPVVALDIDGTLGSYHDHFCMFAEGYLGRKVPTGYDGSVSLARWCGVSKTTYRTIKLAYRQGGMKRSMPVYDGARELTVALRKRGAEVWICTTRPYLRLDNIDPDTRHWLRRHRIQYDGVMYGERKYRDLKTLVGADRVVAVLDDLPEMVQQANDVGLTVVIRDQPYNKGTNWNRRVGSLAEAKRAMLGLLQAWEWRAARENNVRSR